MRAMVAAVLAASLVCATSAWAATPVAGIEEQTLASGLSAAIGIDVAPDGRVFVAEKRGVLKVINPGGGVQTVLDIQTRVNDTLDRGFSGVAVDADFATNRYVYLLYTYEPTGLNVEGPKTSRLTRIQVNADNTVVNPSAPETVLLGTHQPNIFQEACPAAANDVDCIPADGRSHVAGSVRAAPDGTLYVGSGDAMLSAPSGTDPYRPLNEQSYAGKILHVDRNGRGLAGHPFCPATAPGTAVCTKVHAMGFRNPFRFDVSGADVWAGDVGENQFEEIDRVAARGSYGWPCYEGTERFGPRSAAATCVQRYAREGTPDAEKPPFYAYPHVGGAGASIIMGPRMPAGNLFGSAFAGNLVFGDIISQRLDRLVLDSSGAVASVEPIASDWFGTDLRLGPDGALYSANYSGVSRFVPNDGNRPPVARVAADRTYGLAPLTVAFDARTSSDPDGDALTYTWNFGDGGTGSGATPSHTYTTPGRFTARVTARDPGGLTDVADIEIRVGERAPELTITSPAPGARFRAGEPVTLSATASDPEDGPIDGSKITWRPRLVHNDHEHGSGELRGGTTSFTPLEDHDSDSHYLIDVSVTDSGGLTTTERLRLDPETAPLEVVADPAGQGSVSYDGRSHPLPFSHTAAVGFRTTIVVPKTLTSQSGLLAFRGWADGPTTRDRLFTVPPAGARLVARYERDTKEPDTRITEAPSTSSSKRPVIKFDADEPVERFECAYDTALWRNCTSPWTTPTLGFGFHTIRVRAYDWVGNVDATPAEVTILVTAL